MFCTPCCSFPRSNTLRRLQCGTVTEPIQRCRLLSPHWQAEERRWCLHNGISLRQLSSRLRHPMEKICRFLFQLTLKRFSEILNPKCSHWNWSRVPLVRPDTCGLYDNIFDGNGNLRNPLHPYIQHILLRILDHYLNIPCYGYNGQNYGSMLEEICHGRSGNRCTNIFRGDGIGAKLRQDWDASGLGFKFSGSDLEPFDGEDSGDKDKGKDGRDGRDGKDGTDENVEINGKDGKNGKDDTDVKDGTDSKDAKNAKKDKNIKDTKDKDRKSMEDISNLYSKVVQNKHKRKLVVEPEPESDREYEEAPVIVKKKGPPPKPVKKKKFQGTDREYIGITLPVLVHEPFDELKPWTWIRRHPKQMRVIEGRQIGHAKVHHYTRRTLQLQYKKAKHERHAHSMYSMGGSADSIRWGDTFGKRSYMVSRNTQVQPFNYKVLLEKPDAGMQRISVAVRKPPSKTRRDPK